MMYFEENKDEQLVRDMMRDICSEYWTISDNHAIVTGDADNNKVVYTDPKYEKAVDALSELENVFLETYNVEHQMTKFEAALANALLYYQIAFPAGPVK